MKNVLIVSADPEITEVIVRLVNGYEGFQGESISAVDQLSATLEKSAFDILLLGAGFTEQEEGRIKETASLINPELKVIEHYGGGSGLLLEELHRV